MKEKDTWDNGKRQNLEQWSMLHRIQRHCEIGVWRPRKREVMEEVKFVSRGEVRSTGVKLGASFSGERSPGRQLHPLPQWRITNISTWSDFYESIFIIKEPLRAFQARSEV